MNRTGFFSFIRTAATLLFFGLPATVCHAQPENLTTTYKNLPTFIISPKVYATDGYNLITKCTPCIWQVVDQEGKLQTKSVQYTDCPVGFYNEYYPNGKVKLTGQYRENTTGDWHNAYERGYCTARTGEWISYTETGKAEAREFWQDGTFIREVPERAVNEAWKIDLALNGKVLAPDARIAFANLDKLTVVPVFKSTSANKATYTSALIISAVGQASITVPFSSSGQLASDIPALLREKGFVDSSKIYLKVITYNSANKSQAWWLFPRLLEAK